MTIILVGPQKFIAFYQAYYLTLLSKDNPDPLVKSFLYALLTMEIV